jgi:hypothetical protein
MLPLLWLSVRRGRPSECVEVLLERVVDVGDTGATSKMLPIELPDRLRRPLYFFTCLSVLTFGGVRNRMTASTIVDVLDRPDRRLASSSPALPLMGWIMAEASADVDVAMGEETTRRSCMTLRGGDDDSRDWRGRKDSAAAPFFDM